MACPIFQMKKDPKTRKRMSIWFGDREIGDLQEVAEGWKWTGREGYEDGPPHPEGEKLLALVGSMADWKATMLYLDAAHARAANCAPAARPTLTPGIVARGARSFGPAGGVDAPAEPPKTAAPRKERRTLKGYAICDPRADRVPSVPEFPPGRLDEAEEEAKALNRDFEDELDGAQYRVVAVFEAVKRRGARTGKGREDERAEESGG